MLKNLNKTTNYFRALFLLLFIFAEFFGFGVLPMAQAVCKYGISRLDAQSAVNKSDTLNINTTFTQSGSSGDCVNKITLVFLVKASYDIGGGADQGSFHSDELELARISDVEMSGSSLNTQVPYSLSNLDWSKIPNPNQLQLFMRMYVNNSNVTTSAVWNISVTGASNSTNQSGVKNITISFDRASYNKDDKVNIVMSLDNRNNAPDVEIVTSVNGKTIGSFPKTSAELSAAQVQSATISSDNGFTNGANSIEVKMFQKGTNQSILYAQGIAQVQVQGLSTQGNNLPNTQGNNLPNTQGNNLPSNNQTTNNPSNLPTDHIYNPLPTDELTATFINIAKGFLGIVAIWSVIFIIVGGFRMVVAAGNEEALAVAKKTIIWAVLGLIVAALSFSIIAIVQNLLGAKIQ